MNHLLATGYPREETHILGKQVSITEVFLLRGSVVSGQQQMKMNVSTLKRVSGQRPQYPLLCSKATEYHKTIEYHVGLCE